MSTQIEFMWSKLYRHNSGTMNSSNLPSKWTVQTQAEHEGLSWEKKKNSVRLVCPQMRRLLLMLLLPSILRQGEDKLSLWTNYSTGKRKFEDKFTFSVFPLLYLLNGSDKVNALVPILFQIYLYLLYKFNYIQIYYLNL